MIKYILENQALKIAVRSKGAELTSIFNKNNNLEYLWQADPTYWNRHAPVLFPIVGKLKNDAYSYAGKEYAMSQHGFARDLEFSVVQDTKDTLRFQLEDQPQTHPKFPFKFSLEISYYLESSSVGVGYKVKNIDSQDIYFSIGAHPAFNCPLTEEEKFEDYSLFFEVTENSKRHLLSDGLFTGKEEPIPFQGKELPLSYRYFEKDAIVMKHFNSDSILLKSRSSGLGVRVSFEGFPFLGIWTKRKGAPFLCIEPWCGLADSQNSTGEISEKEGIQKLKPGEEFNKKYKIEIL